MKVREPVARPLDVVGVELLLSAAQAYLVGVLLYVAVGFWADHAVALGSVAFVLVLMGIAVGAGWLYWLLGGVGWPMAAANVPVAIFFGVTLVLGWLGEDVFRVRGAPVLVAESGAIFGIVAGVFLDSPRRWRWDQRERLRPGTKVPRVSPVTRAVVVAVPRSIPRRAESTERMSELAARIEGSTPAGSTPSVDVGIPYVRDDGPASTAGQPGSSLGPAGSTPPSADAARDGPASDDEELTDAPAVEGATLEVPEAPEPTLPTAGRARTAAADDKVTRDGVGADEGIELPTMVEPRAQRSPWAWAAPPEWNRDEEDEVSRTSKR